MKPLSFTSWSLKHRLLATLLALTLALWGSSAAIVYVEAQQESDELFDQSLVETAHLLQSLVENEAREHGLSESITLSMTGSANQRPYLLLQVRDAQQRILYKNNDAPATALAPDSPDGLSWTTIEGKLWRLCTLWDAPRQIVLVVAEPTSHREDISSRFFYKIVVFGTLLALVAAAAIWWSINRVIQVLQKSAHEVAARTPSDLAQVTLAGAPREVHPLLLAINRLFTRVQQTMEHQQRFTADAAHELRTPLAAIKTNLQVLKRARNDHERDEFISGLSTSVERATRLVDQLLALEKMDPQSGTITAAVAGDLGTLLAERAPHWETQCRQNGLTLKVQISPAPCAFHLDSVCILLRNLVENAVRYTPAAGSIVISCGREGRYAFLQVADSGPGIPLAMQERVFERFFRLAGSQLPGSGLGLSIVQRVAERHGAQIRMGTGLHGAGLSVTVLFPHA